MWEHTNREFTQYVIWAVKDMEEKLQFLRFAPLGNQHYTAVRHVAPGNTRMMFGSVVILLVM